MKKVCKTSLDSALSVEELLDNIDEEMPLVISEDIN